MRERNARGTERNARGTGAQRGRAGGAERCEVGDARSAAGGWRGELRVPRMGGLGIVPDMRASEIRQLIRMKPVELDTTRRRLGACHDIDDLRAMGRRLIPRPVFDYVDGGADEELSMEGNLRAFRRWRFQPRALPEITTVDTSARLLDRDLPLPLALAPTGYTRMMHPGGEIAAARSAQQYMAFIAPFRHWVVYPALLRQIERAWQAR